jgi:hypothetical protein
VIDIGVSYKELKKNSGGSYIDYATGTPLRFYPSVVKKEVTNND